MRLRILLVDDHDEGRTALRELLQFWGHEVVEASTPAVAREVAVGFHPDVAIVDLAKPRGTNGGDVARAFRGRPDCPVLIAFTAQTHADDKQRAYDAGFDFAVPKPGGIDDLQALLAVSEMHASRARSGS